MTLINKATRLKVRKTLVKNIRDAIKTTHGVQSDLCAIWAVDGQVMWETSHTNGRLCLDQPIELLIRKLVGQNLLTLAGLPQEEEDIPVIYLAPFPSLINLIGLKRYIKLVKEWPGRSMARDVEVIRYKLI